MPPTRARRLLRLVLPLSALLAWAMPVAFATPPAAAGVQRAAIAGVPLMRRYGAEDYKAAPQHFAVVADAKGRLLAGSAEGVLRFDGEEWQLIELPGRTTARSLALGADGRVYVGGYDSFGWLEEEEGGETHYRELLTAAGLTGDERYIGIVWDVLPTPDGVYFQSERDLHFLSYQHDGARTWPLPESTRGFYAEGRTLYVRIHGLGLSRFSDGRFVLEPGGERFAERRLPALVPRDGWRLLVADDGFYRADARGITPLPDGAGSELRGTRPYCARLLSDGSLVVGTVTGELLRFDAALRLRQRVDLGSYGIQALASDLEGGLWAATENGLARVSVPSPWSFFGADQGLRGNLFDFEWFGGAIWLAGSRGVARLARDADGNYHTERKPWTELEAFDLLASPAGLLIGHREGLWLLSDPDGEPRTLIGDASGGFYALIRSRHDPNLVYAMTNDQLYLLVLRDGQWTPAHALPFGDLSPYGIEEGAPGELWFGDSRGGPQRWLVDLDSGQLRSRRTFDAADGLELDPMAGSSLYQIDGRMHVVSGPRGYRWEDDRWVVDVSPPFTLVDRPEELVVEQTPLGDYAYTSRQLWHRARNTPQWRPIHLHPGLAAGFGSLGMNADGVLRVSTWRGLLQYDPGEAQPPRQPLAVGMARVLARAPGGDPARDRVLPTDTTSAPALVPPGYSLSLRFGLVSMESGAQFRYLLHGVTPDWSDWSDRDLFIRSLEPGDYVLEVQARTRSGLEVPGLSYRFQVQPHWYQQWWARASGLVLLAGLAWLATRALVRRRTERFQSANRRLESRIAERTRELEDANRKLAELATEDPLTGVANRRALEQGLQREWFRCLDQRRPVSAMMIDVDHFKGFNDAHGHLEGDEKLKAIAQRLVRQHDAHRELLARYGGEEFALLMPGVHLEEAMRRAETLRTAIASSDLAVTVSIGVAGFVPDVQAEPDSLLRRADAALYRAKRAGRNRVVADAD